MKFNPVSALAALTLVLCASASVQAQSDNTYSTRAQVCPPGTSAGTCMNNAFAIIDDLQRRVAILETGRRASAAQPMSDLEREETTPVSGGNKTASSTDTHWWPKSHECLPGWTWDGTACGPRN